MMNEAKYKQLLAASRACVASEPPMSFSDDVLSTIRRSDRMVAGTSLFDQLGLLFPRLAMAAVVVIVVALVFQFFGMGDIVTQLSEASDDWLLPLNWL